MVALLACANAFGYIPDEVTEGSLLQTADNGYCTGGRDEMLCSHTHCLELGISTGEDCYAQCLTMYADTTCVAVSAVGTEEGECWCEQVGEGCLASDGSYTAYLSVDYDIPEMC